MQETLGAWIKKNILALISVVLTGGILIFFLLRENGLQTLYHLLGQLQPVWIGWIAAGVLGGWLLESYVLHLLCKHLHPNWSFGRSFYVAMIGLFYSSITPFSMGEPMEVYEMNRMGMETGTATSVIAIKSLIHHAVTFFYSLILVCFELRYFQQKVTNYAFFSLFGFISNSLFILAVVLFMINERITGSILNALVRLFDKIGFHKFSKKFNTSVHGQLMVFHESSRRMGKATSLYVYTVVLTLVQITVASLISYFVYRSFNLHEEPVFIMVAADTFVTMAASFIPLPGSSGGAEGGFYIFFHEFFGNTIIPAILLWRVATYYVNILFGCVLVCFGRRLHSLAQRGDIPEKP